MEPGFMSSSFPDSTSSTPSGFVTYGHSRLSTVSFTNDGRYPVVGRNLRDLNVQCAMVMRIVLRDTLKHRIGGSVRWKLTTSFIRLKSL